MYEHQPTHQQLSTGTEDWINETGFSSRIGLSAVDEYTVLGFPISYNNETYLMPEDTFPGLPSQPVTALPELPHDVSTLDDFLALDLGLSTTENFCNYTTLTASAIFSQPSLNQQDKKSNDSVPWQPPDLDTIGYRTEDGTWKCNYTGCGSLKTFDRACDIRKHFHSHTKRYYCRFECDCFVDGFSSLKDCKRHEASYNPKLKCPDPNCQRVFSRSGECIALEIEK